MSVTSRVRSVALALSLFALSLFAAGGTIPAAASVPSKAQATKAQVASAYGRLPLAFEQNKGQSDPQVKFLSKGPGYTLFLTPTQAVMTLSKPSAAPRPGQKRSQMSAPPKASVLRMTLKGANSAPAVVGKDKLPGEAAYCVGDKSHWRSHVATYGQVSYSNVYPGVDLRYYGNQRQLEYDFIVKPGADPKAIALGFEGAKNVALNKQGDLLLSTAGRGVRWHKPVAYQTVNGCKVPVASRFVVSGGTARFAVGRYDKKLPLTIDPSLGYSTFLGGSEYDDGQAIAVDSSGSAYVTGYTYSTDFPRTLNDASSNADVFITKVNPTGTALVYSIVLGGGGTDVGLGIAVDSHGFVDVCGYTSDGTFPAGSGTYLGDDDGFLAQVKSDGSGFYFIEYIHVPGADDSGDDVAESVAVDSSDNIYVGGYSEYDTSYFYTLADILKFNSEGVLQAYNEATGYDGGETYGYGVAVDADNNVYLTGETGCADLYDANNTYKGNGDAFVAKLTSDLDYDYATYVGGTGYDYGEGIAVDAGGSAYITGGTTSSDFPVTEGPAYMGDYDAFVTKLNSDGTALSYSTLLKSTPNYDYGYGIGVDSLGQAYVSGSTTGTNSGMENVFVAQLTSTGSLKDSRNLIGADGQYGYGLAVGANSVAYVTGTTYSSDFRVTTGAYDTSFNGNADAFVDAVAFNSPVLTSISPTSVYAGSGTFTLTANGTGFIAGGKVYFNSTALTTTYVSSTKLTASVPSSLITSTGSASLSVVSPSAGGTSGAKTLTITPKLTALALSPTSVTGGVNSTGTVTLSGNAPSAGVVVTLSSSSTGAATVPSSVTVTSGHNSATFTVTSKPVSSNTTVTITTSGAGATKTATLAVNAPKLSSLSLSSAVVSGGTNVTATVTLTGKAPSGGTVVTPSSSGSAATVPSSVTVASGATSATFPITTHSVSSNTNVTIGAVAGGVTKTQTLTITAGSGPVTITGLSLSPTSVKGGSATSTGTITLSGPAPSGGLAVTQTSSDTSAATLAGTLNIAAGATSAKFKITTYAVSSTKTVTIKSSANGSSKTATLTVTH